MASASASSCSASFHGKCCSAKARSGIGSAIPSAVCRCSSVSFVFCLGGLLWWEARRPHPLIDLRPFKDRNFVISCLIIFCSFGVLYGSSTQLPALLETLFGYDAFHAGLVLSPAGIFTILAIIVVGRALGMGVDARWLILTGLLILAAGNYWMSLLNLDVAPSQIIWPRVVLVTGLGFVFAPLNVAAYLTIPRAYRGAAVGIFALLRNEGGSVGTTLGKTITERREIFHNLRLNETLDPLNPAVTGFLDQFQVGVAPSIGDPVAAQQLAYQNLANLRGEQALALSYFDCFFIFAILGVVLAFAVLFR